MTKRIVIFSWLAIALAIFVYSYGFVDFNLTLSSHPVVMQFVTWCQSLAMFNRPLSLTVFLVITTLLFTLYFLTLRVAKAYMFTSFPYKLVIILALIFALSYPFLSHDVFKYLFSGRMVVDYGLNPHLFSPDQVVGDDWLRFLRWVHTPSPYGPFMTVLASAYYLLGAGKFVPTLYLFKLDQIGWYILAIFLIGKLSGKITKSKNKAVISQLIFALNPLILVEWLVNAHNDAPMITLLLLSLYLLTQKKRLLSLTSLIFSVAIKYITIIFLPLILLKKRLKLTTMTYYLLSVLTLAPLLYKYSFQYQPWYVTWLIPLVAILPLSPLTYIVTAYSLGSLLRYIPFIRTGLWGATPVTFALYSFAPPVIAGVVIFLIRARRRL